MPIRHYEVVGVRNSSYLPHDPTEFRPAHDLREVVLEAIRMHEPFDVSAMALLNEISRRRGESQEREFTFRASEITVDPFAVNVRELETPNHSYIGADTDGVYRFSIAEV